MLNLWTSEDKRHGARLAKSKAEDVTPPAPPKPKNAPLYQKQEKIHPKRVWGLYRQLKWVALTLLLSIYYIAPWIRWDRGAGVPDQAWLIDMNTQRAYFLWIEIWPQEIYYITGILIVAALGLFMATALFGRIWCGFACPQTVWTDLFVWVERLVEGDHAARVRLDKAEWSVSKITKRTIKHTIWLFISLFTGGAWILYFVDAPTFMGNLFSYGAVSGNIAFFIGLFTFTTYLLAGFGREQVCTYMCPWPRIQASMVDEDSMIITYEGWRGEPRAKPARDGDYSDRGHCIDCFNCVVVCPMGIDIRDGNQLECIGCGLCIDACDNIMEKMDLPKGLIAYDSLNRQLARAEGKETKRRLVRPRTVFYAVLIAAVCGLILYTFGSRSHLDVNILKDRNPLFVTLKDGSIRNGYEIKILNKTQYTRNFLMHVEGLETVHLKRSGENEDKGFLIFNVGPDGILSQHIFLSTDAKKLNNVNQDIQFRFTEMDASSTDGGLGIMRENQLLESSFNSGEH